jgi:hypothetical protein
VVFFPGNEDTIGDRLEHYALGGCGTEPQRRLHVGAHHDGLRATQRGNLTKVPDATAHHDAAPDAEHAQAERDQPHEEHEEEAAAAGPEIAPVGHDENEKADEEKERADEDEGGADQEIEDRPRLERHVLDFVAIEPDPHREASRCPAEAPTPSVRSRRVAPCPKASPSPSAPRP